MSLFELFFSFYVWSVVLFAFSGFVRIFSLNKIILLNLTRTIPFSTPATVGAVVLTLTRSLLHYLFLLNLTLSVDFVLSCSIPFPFSLALFPSLPISFCSPAARRLAPMVVLYCPYCPRCAASSVPSSVGVAD